MAWESLFEWLCDTVESRTQLDRLAARGAVRLALKRAGFDAVSVSRGELTVVVRKVLSGTLQRMDVAEAEALCNTLAGELQLVNVEESAQRETPEQVFRRFVDGS